MATADLTLTLEATTPAAVRRHAIDALVDAGFAVAHSEDLDILLLTLTESPFKQHAEEIGMLKALAPSAERRWSEVDFPMREYDRTVCSDAFTPAERATVCFDYLERHLKCTDGWTTALAASGRSDAAKHPRREWLVGPPTEAGHVWSGQPLLGALTALGYLAALSHPLRWPSRKCRAAPLDL